MPDQLEHALRRRTELLTSRSKSEVAAINALQRVYELLLSRSVKESHVLQPGRIRRPQSARLNPASPGHVVKQCSTADLEAPRLSAREDQEPSQPNGAEVLEAFASLIQLSSKLDTTASELQVEVSSSERRCRALQADPTSYLPSVDPSELPPRLQVLQSVLGQQRFQQYTRDLYAEVAQLRRRSGLYGSNCRRFIQEIAAGGGKVISSEAVSIMLHRQDSRVHDDSQSAVSGWLLTFQHCSDSQVPTQLSVEELGRVLSSMPASREKLVRHAFEQLSDGWRGEGYAPPPDSIRAHRLHAIVKESFAHQQCSTTERDVVAAWINSLDQDGSGNASVPLRDFLEFHHPKSDEFPLEDAEFVRYLLRIWCFDPSSSLAMAPRTDRDAVARVILSSDERTIHEQLMARKRELVSKIHSALGGLATRAQQLRVQLGTLQRLDMKSTTVATWWNDPQLADDLGSSLASLRILAAPGYSLPAFPAFTSSLAQLEVLDLRDNRLALIPRELGQLSALRSLDLSANCLTDASFSQSDCSWGDMTALSELVLNGNRLTTVPDQVSCLPSLQKLSVAENAIRRVPRCVLKAWGESSKLVLLDLHHNSLTSLPDGIGQLRGMKCLLLHDNALSSLPATIASLTQLEELTVAGNRLGNEFTEFPVAEAQTRIVLDRNDIRELPHLKLVSQNAQSNVVRVSVANNQLRRLPTTATPALAMCKELRLEHNAIRELPDAFFESLPLLEEIVLHHNRMLRVPASITKCKYLRVIDMHANRISEVPSELVELSQLEVLDFMDNALQAIPVRWHAFSRHSRGPPLNRRVLQTLVLRRNPIRNNVLKSIVDGFGHDGVPEVAAALTNSSDRVSEIVLRKLIASLRDAATTNVAFDCISSDSEEEEEEERERERMHGSAVVPNSRRKWRGVTRDVNRYLAQRLRAMKRQKSEGSMKQPLCVETKSFERMIKSLPFACSKLELATLIKRLAVNGMEGKQWVDGSKFLAEIDSLGQSGSLASTSPRRTGANPTTDAVAQILHYLWIMHRQQRQSRNGDKQDQLQAKPSVDAPLENPTVAPKQPKTTAKTAKVATRRDNPRTTSSPGKRSEARSEAAANSFVARVSAPSRVGELARQRQRVKVLQQQLMDHKLQLLHQSRQPSASPIAPASMGDDSSSEPSESGSGSDRDPDGGSDVICVRVSLPTSGPTVDATAAVRARHLDVRIGMLQTVLDLKQRIEVRTSLPVGDQILIAKDRGQPVGIRLCNASTIQQSVRSDRRISEKTPWRLLLLLRHGG